MQSFFLLLFLFASISLAGAVTQTDWSGGSGVPGPVTDWGNSYDVGDQIDHTADFLCLTEDNFTTPVENAVDSNFDGAQSVYAVDLDLDGDMDVLGASSNDEEIAWWENTDGTGTSWTKHTVDGFYNGARSVHVADLDGDGDLDVLGASIIYYDITWWENTDGTGTSWIEHTVDGDFEGACSVHGADVDGDGDMDILGAANYDNEITWWENGNGIGTIWIVRIVDSSFNGAKSVYAADVDGDGDMDVLGAASGANDITWWENTNGTGTSWTEHTVDGNFGNASSVYATDVDGDGDTDVLGTAANADDVAWWENTDGTGTSWTEHTVDGNFNNALSVFAMDLDGDSDTDVLGAASMADDIAWWENTDGTGTTWVEHTVDGDFNGACSVHAADFDGDGYTDILGGAAFTSTICWWKDTGYLEGTLESSILDAGTVASWGDFVFNGVEPSGTSLGFQFRSSQDSSSMGTWSDSVFTSSVNLSAILTDSTNFMQYKVILQTTDPFSTPVLNDVEVSYTTYVNIGETSCTEVANWGLATSANPAFGNFSVLVSSPQQGTINLVLHDVTGRVIAQYSNELPAGTHSVSFNNIAEGVYFCTMRVEDFNATERIVVLK